MHVIGARVMPRVRIKVRVRYRVRVRVRVKVRVMPIPGGRCNKHASWYKTAVAKEGESRRRVRLAYQRKS